MSAIFDKLFVFLFLAFAAAMMLALLCVPTVIAFYLKKWLKRKGIPYLGTILLIVAPVWTAYEMYTAVYPTESFYASEFSRVTLTDLPSSANFLRKTASYPDFHGEYCSASVLSVSPEDYQHLLQQLLNDKTLWQANDNHYRGSDEFNEAMGSLKPSQILHGFIRPVPNQDDHYLYIGFLSDKKTLVVNVCVT